MASDRAGPLIALSVLAAAVLAHQPGGAAAGQQVQGDRYQLQLVELARCQSPRGMPASDWNWVGFSVELAATARGMFVTARDFTLEKRGIVLKPRHINPPLLPGCLPVLPAEQLQPEDGPSRGFVLFEVPARFRTEDGPMTLAYQPTRWGGARRVEISVPACLDQCDSPRTRVGQQRGSTRSRTH